MKVKKLVSMLCVIAIVATACMFNVIAESTTSNSFTLSLAGLNANDYNADDYTAINGSNGVVSLKLTTNTKVNTDCVQVYKNQKAIKIAPTVAGSVTVTFDNGSIKLTDKENKDSTFAESPYSFEVESGDIYEISGTGSKESNKAKVYSINFTAKSDEPTAEFSAVASKAILSGDDVTDGSVATGFTTTVTNTGNASGSISKLNWTVTSDDETGKETVNLGTVTLGSGASAKYGLIIKGLHDSAATADVTVE